ncbi:MAG TPA: hypothetical protein VMH89_06895 [Candidatus Acidoferrum sp.]|nr:hypothetical protein [Candidatus Acidoferrum sp.]
MLTGVYPRTNIIPKLNFVNYWLSIEGDDALNGSNFCDTDPSDSFF